jgi:hypothetical protein
MMAPIRQIALGLTIASGAVLTAWLLTGDRKQKTKDYIVKRSDNLRKALKTDKPEYDDSEVHYI